MEPAMLTRINFLGTAQGVERAPAISGRGQGANIPEAPTMNKATMQPPLRPTSGPDYNPVVTLNGWTLPWRINGDCKEFHLVADPLELSFPQGTKPHLWFYNPHPPTPTLTSSTG